MVASSTCMDWSTGQQHGALLALYVPRELETCMHGRSIPSSAWYLCLEMIRPCPCDHAYKYPREINCWSHYPSMPMTDNSIQVSDFSKFYLRCDYDDTENNVRWLFQKLWPHAFTDRAVSVEPVCVLFLLTIECSWFMASVCILCVMQTSRIGGFIKNIGGNKELGTGPTHTTPPTTSEHIRWDQRVNRYREPNVVCPFKVIVEALQVGSSLSSQINLKGIFGTKRANVCKRNSSHKGYLGQAVVSCRVVFHTGGSYIGSSEWGPHLI